MSNAQEPLKVSDEIIAICAVNATRRTDGVAAMAGGFTDMLNKSLLGREIAAKGVKVSQVKSKTVSRGGAEMTIELRVDKQDALLNRVLAAEGVQDATLVAYQPE